MVELFRVSFHLNLGIPHPLCPCGRPKMTLRAGSTGSMCITWPTHWSLVSLIRWTTTRSSMYRLLHWSSTCKGPKILLSIFFSNATKKVSQCSCRRGVCDYWYYKGTGTIKSQLCPLRQVIWGELLSQAKEWLAAIFLQHPFSAVGANLWPEIGEILYDSYVSLDFLVERSLLEWLLYKPRFFAAYSFPWPASAT